MKTFEIIKGVGAIGLTYHSCPYWDRRDGRPSVNISLWLIKVILRLPYKHTAYFGNGTATDDYGIYWWPKVCRRPLFMWQTLKRKIK